jgi:uracil-DNA glycosylase family protein
MRAGKPGTDAEARPRERSAIDFLPEQRSLRSLRTAARDCHGCDLYRNATQTVFGEGPSSAALMIVGEVPGDQEDLQGHPFVGPAGKLLDEALSAAGLARDEVYLTNVVKHFKWEQRGKRRLHGKPSTREIVACRPWLEAEIEALHPRTIVCLGATAAQALLGRDFRITRQRGELISSAWATWTVATYHPSAVLRAPEAADRRRMREELMRDLQVAADTLTSLVPGERRSAAHSPAGKSVIK